MQVNPDFQMISRTCYDVAGLTVAAHIDRGRLG
jgi:hypothetical protein